MNKMWGDFQRLDAKGVLAGTVTVTSTVDAAQVDADKITLTSTWYKSIHLGINDLQTTAAASYALVSVTTAAATAGALGIFLDDTATEIAGFSFTLPKDFLVGSSIKPYIQYGCTSATGSTGAITFGIAWHEINSTPTTALGNMTNQEIATMGSSAVLSIITTYFAAIGSTSLKAGSLISGCLYRNATGVGTTYCDLDAVVYGLGFLYKTDGMGSTYVTAYEK